MTQPPPEPEPEPVPAALERIEDDVEQIAEVARALPTVELRRLLELLRRGSFSGPLPPPEILEGYKAAYADAPKIVFGELIKQGEHRRGIEKNAIERQEARADRGQIFALVIVLAALVVGLVAVLADEGWVAAALFGGALVSIVGMFIYGSRRQVGDLGQKRRRLRRALPEGESITGEDEPEAEI